MIRVMVVGLENEAAGLVVKEVEKTEDMNLVPFTLAKEEGKLLVGKTEIWQIVPRWHEDKLKEIAPDIIIHLASLNSNISRNVGLYCQCRIPFVLVIDVGIYWRNSEMVEGLGIPAVVMYFNNSGKTPENVIKSVQFLISKHQGEIGIFTINDVLQARD